MSFFPFLSMSLFFNVLAATFDAASRTKLQPQLQVLKLPLLVAITGRALPDLDLIALHELAALVVEAEGWDGSATTRTTTPDRTHSSGRCT
jgi:hypothetical protein